MCPLVFDICAAPFKTMPHLTCSYEVAVERVGVEVIADRFGSSYEGLTNYLTPKQTLTARHPVVCPSGGGEEKHLNHMQLGLTR